MKSEEWLCYLEATSLFAARIDAPFQNKRPKAMPLPTQRSFRQLLRDCVAFRRFNGYSADL